MQCHHTAHPDPVGRERSGDRVDASDELTVGDLGTRRPITGRDAVKLTLTDRPEQEVVDAEVGNLDIGVRAAKNHRASPSEVGRWAYESVKPRWLGAEGRHEDAGHLEP